MSTLARPLAVLLLGLAFSVPAVAATGAARVDAAESAFLDYLDAVSAVGFIEAGSGPSYAGGDLASWQRALAERRLA